MSISAMKMALEALEYYRSFEDCQPTPASKTIPALRQALAQEVTTQVTMQVTTEVTKNVDAVNMKQERVDETPKGEHEPVARVEYDRKGNIAWLFGPIEPDGTLLYTAPPKREWVGLTDEDIEAIADTIPIDEMGGPSTWHIKFSRSIEAKLKEKNT
jgi:hypothetical protein